MDSTTMSACGFSCASFCEINAPATDRKQYRSRDRPQEIWIGRRKTALLEHRSIFFIRDVAVPIRSCDILSVDNNFVSNVAVQKIHFVADLAKHSECAFVSLEIQLGTLVHEFLVFRTELPVNGNPSFKFISLLRVEMNTISILVFIDLSNMWW
jgi:hypothetical protein